MRWDDSSRHAQGRSVGGRWADADRSAASGTSGGEEVGEVGHHGLHVRCSWASGHVRLEDERTGGDSGRVPTDPDERARRRDLRAHAAHGRDHGQAGAVAVGLRVAGRGSRFVHLLHRPLKAAAASGRLAVGWFDDLEGARPAQQVGAVVRGLVAGHRASAVRLAGVARLLGSFSRRVPPVGARASGHGAQWN